MGFPSLASYKYMVINGIFKMKKKFGHYIVKKRKVNGKWHIYDSETKRFLDRQYVIFMLMGNYRFDQNLREAHEYCDSLN